MPTDHSLRVIKMLADQALKELSPDLDRMYANVGRPSIPPERLLKSSLLIALYSARSERAFCEQLDYNLLFRWYLEWYLEWYLDMNLIEPSFDATTFTKNRERLLRHGVGQALFGEVVLEAERQGLLSDEHFTVDGTLIEAAASLKGFKPKDGDPPRATDADPGNPSVDFHGERRSNATHQSTTDPEARLLRKGKGKLAGCPGRGSSSKARFRPPSRYRRLVRHTVPADVSSASTMRSIPQAASAFSRIRARATFRAGFIPPRINRSSWSRSSSFNRTTYRSRPMAATLLRQHFSNRVATLDVFLNNYQNRVD